MEGYSMLASIFTVLSFLVFVGIVFWAYSARRTLSFAAAANEPFVLPDEADARSSCARESRQARSPGDSRGTGAAQ